VILAGGAGRRLGGAAKPTLAVAGHAMLTRVLDAVAGAAERVVVGPPELADALPPGVRLTREEPAGGGPVAALAAGLAALVAGSTASADAVALAHPVPLADPVPSAGAAESAADQAASAGPAALAADPAALAAGPAPPDRPAGGMVAILAADLPLLTVRALDDLRCALAAAGPSLVDGAVYLDGTGRHQWLCGVWWEASLRERLAAFGPPGGRSLRDLLGPHAIVAVGAPPDRPPPWYDCDTPEDLRTVERWIDER